MNTNTQNLNLCPPRGAAFNLAPGRGRPILMAVAILTAIGLTSTVRADRVGHNIAAGYLEISEPTPGDYNNANTTAGLLIGVNGLSVVTNVVNMGDYRVQIGDSFTDDTNNGVIIVSAAQNGNANWTNSSGVLTNNFQTTCSIPYGGGHWEAGVFKSPPISSTTPNQGEDNVNVTVAYFPFTQFIGGYALNGANGLELTNLVGSSGLVLGTHFMDYLTNSAVSDAVANGVFYLDLRSFGIDSRRDGVLLVNHAKNEANYALSRVNNDDNEMDGTWTIYTHDNRANGRSYEQDPVAFVFVPKSNTDVVSGMFMGDGAISIHSGAAPAFSVAWRTDLGSGTYELKVPGRSTADGILIVSPAGGDSINGDNIVTFQPNAAGDGWLIQSRDLPACGLQSEPENEPVCSFVFIPAERPGITVTPNKNVLTTENGGAAQFTVTLNGYPKPTADVTLNLSSSDTGEGDVSPNTLTFTPADWNVPMTVTVTGMDDAQNDGTQPYTINLSATTSADANFNGLIPGNVGAINIDNESGISVDASRIVTTEAGGTATFSVWLNTAPTADVTLALSSSDLTEATVAPNTLTFTPADYSTPQVVTVTGADDQVQDGPAAYFVVTATAASADPVYNNFNALDVEGENMDNDLARVIVPADKLTITEPNTSATFSLVLATEPTANVTINCASSDTTEGTVTPSVTFTPSNWSTPKTVTVIAVDDLLNDGTVEFSIITTVTSTDPVYAALNPDDVSVVTVDNEAALALAVSDLTYGIGDPPQGLDGYATISDSDTANYNTGSLTVTITAGGGSADRLAVRHTGTAPEQIGVSGNTVSYGGVAIGTLSGGTGTTPLSITFNSSATPVAAEALIRSVTYQNVDVAAAPQTRTVTLTLADGHSGVSTVTIGINLREMRVYSYQFGADGGFGPYTHADDTQIHHQFPEQNFPAGYSTLGLWIDFDTSSLIPTDQMQCLLRFTNLFGTNPGQIPPGAKIVFADLIMNVTDSGHGARFNRMLGDWDSAGSTFNSFGEGIQLDDTEAVSGTNSFLSDQAHNTTTGGGLMKIGVTSDVQAWAGGAANYGWVMSPWEGGDNGTAFSPCEATNITLRPRLNIGWVPASAEVATFQEGVSGYTGTIDSQIRLVLPDTQYAASAYLSPDWLVSATPIPNQQQVMVRFDNIIGDSEGQIPMGSVIHAAFLELTSITADAQGAGAMFHGLLKPWDDTNTWNIWVDGIATDGVDAVAAATSTLPAGGMGTAQATRHNVELTADVQAWAYNQRPNYGWAVMPWPNGNNGWGFNASEAALADTRPILRVYFTPGELPEVITLGTPVYSGGQVLLSFTGTANRTYTVERVGALGGTWAPIGTAIANGTGAGTFTDNAPLASAAFYRIAYP